MSSPHNVRWSIFGQIKQRSEWLLQHLDRLPAPVHGDPNEDGVSVDEAQQMTGLDRLLSRAMVDLGYWPIVRVHPLLVSRKIIKQWAIVGLETLQLDLEDTGACVAVGRLVERLDRQYAQQEPALTPDDVGFLGNPFFDSYGDLAGAIEMQDFEYDGGVGSWVTRGIRAGFLPDLGAIPDILMSMARSIARHDPQMAPLLATYFRDVANLAVHEAEKLEQLP